jgi:hypothetical protein
VYWKIFRNYSARCIGKNRDGAKVDRDRAICIQLDS